MEPINALAKVSSSQSPYQLNPEQTLKASKALLEHIRKETTRLQVASSKKNLLQTEDVSSGDDEVVGDEIPVWLTLTTKQHVVDRNRLIPSKIPVPHSLNASENLTICLITVDPQRALKNVVADPAFPTALSSRITKIIGLTKLKDRYKTFEQRRALLSEHDIFLADDRIVTRLPAILGKIFYKGTSKRPIPIAIAEQRRVDGKRVKATPEERKSKHQGSAPVASPAIVGKEIEKAIGAVAVNLKPGTSVATRVGLSSFTPQQLVDNITVVLPHLIQKHVVKGWRNVKAVYIKSPESMAIPIWLADELWAEDNNIEEGTEVEVIEAESENLKRKRNPNTTKGPQVGSRKKAKSEELKYARLTEERERNASRKKQIEAQKEQILKDMPIAAWAE